MGSGKHLDHWRWAAGEDVATIDIHPNTHDPRASCSPATTLFFRWRQSRAGAERCHSAMLPHGGTGIGTGTDTWREVGQPGADPGRFVGLPAVTRHDVGRGTATYLGTSPDPATLRRIVPECAQRVGARPVLEPPKASRRSAAAGRTAPATCSCPTTPPRRPTCPSARPPAPSTSSPPAGRPRCRRAKSM